MENQPKLNVDIKATQPITDKDGNHLFCEGIILRKVSKFLVGGKEDGIIPINCFYNPQTGKILTELLPKDLQSEYEALNEQQDNK